MTRVNTPKIAQMDVTTAMGVNTTRCCQEANFVLFLGIFHKMSINDKLIRRDLPG